MKMNNLIGKRYGRLTVMECLGTVKGNSRWLCKCDCGNDYEVFGYHLIKGSTQSCGCLNTELRRIRMKRIGTEQCGDKSGKWKGGVIRYGRYIYVKKSGHPRTTKEGYVSEHILVIESVLGRYLYPGEVVHHINGDTTDNRPSNLRVFSTGSDHIHHHAVLNGKTSHKGVYYSKRNKTWSASKAGKYLGYFKTELEAINAYSEYLDSLKEG